MKVSEITLQVKEVDQLLIAPGSLFYGIRSLSPEAEEFIIEEAALAASNDHFHLKIHLHKSELSRMNEISTAIHHHFTYRRKRSEMKLKKILQRGWRSLLIAIIFLGLLISLTLTLIKLMPEGGLSITVRELLIILGWVALWRPVDLLLYEWRPFKREVLLFRNLEECKVEVVTGKQQ